MTICATCCTSAAGLFSAKLFSSYLNIPVSTDQIQHQEWILIWEVFLFEFRCSLFLHSLQYLVFSRTLFLHLCNNSIPYSRKLVPDMCWIMGTMVTSIPTKIIKRFPLLVRISALAIMCSKISLSYFANKSPVEVWPVSALYLAATGSSTVKIVLNVFIWSSSSRQQDLYADSVKLFSYIAINIRESMKILNFIES